jgi:hypothetical protein
MNPCAAYDVAVSPLTPARCPDPDCPCTVTRDLGCIDPEMSQIAPMGHPCRGVQEIQIMAGKSAYQFGMLDCMLSWRM